MALQAQSEYAVCQRIALMVIEEEPAVEVGLAKLQLNFG
jgi:hypothetical protein